MNAYGHLIILALATTVSALTANAQHATVVVPSSTRLTFAVMGDPQPEEPPTEEPLAFREILRDLHALNPDAIMIVGDLIRGFTDDSLMLRREWEGFFAAVRGFTIPFMYAVGNHDIWDERSQREYLKHFGSLYGSWDIGAVHFISLNSFDLGGHNTIPAGQLEWLRNDLEAHRSARHIFVGVHTPLWAFGNASNWQSEVHPLLRRYNVRAVFAGHWHIYQRSGIQDGIRYYITGGAGGMMPETSTGTGDFHHYMLISVRDDSVSYAVMTPGSVMKDDIVTRESSAFFMKLADEVVGDPRLLLRDDSSATATATVRVKNVFAAPLHGNLRWVLSPEMFTLDRYEREFVLAPGDRADLRFAFTARAGSTSAFTTRPRPRFECTLRLGDSALGPPVTKELVIVHTVASVQLHGRMAIDGNLADWPGSWPITIASRSQVTLVPGRWAGPQESSGEFAVALGDSELYFAGRVVDPDILHASREAEPYQADAVSLYLDLRDSLSFQQRFFTDGIFLAVFAPESDDHRKAYWISVYPNAHPMKDIRFGSQRTDDEYTVEASIPLRELPHFPGRGSTVGLDVCIDNLQANGNRTRLLWNGIWANFMYANRYGLLHLR